MLVIQCRVGERVTVGQASLVVVQRLHHHGAELSITDALAGGAPTLRRCRERDLICMDDQVIVRIAKVTQQRIELVFSAPAQVSIRRVRVRAPVGATVIAAAREASA